MSEPIDPCDVELPALADADLALVLLERSSFGKAGIPPAYLFAIVRRADQVEVGKLVFRVDSDTPGVLEYAGHVAYEIAPEHRGHHYAARACLLLRPLVRVHFDVAWIMISPDNPASIRTAERIGAEHVDTREVPLDSDIRALGVERVHRYRWIV